MPAGNKQRTFRIIIIFNGPPNPNMYSNPAGTVIMKLQKYSGLPHCQQQIHAPTE
jgi:hypothetical protein